jgi:hypothetical protein
LKFFIPAALGVFLALGSGQAHAAWNPPDWEKSPARSSDAGPVNTGSVVLSGALGFYRSFLSPTLGARCPSYPSCSTYALEAVRRHGPLLGAALTSGRLLSEADEAAFAPRILVNGKLYVYDPVPGVFLTGPDGEKP